MQLSNKIKLTEQNTIDKKALKLFLMILIPASTVLELLQMTVPSPLIIPLLMWVPGIAALVVSRIYYRGQNATGWHKFKVRYALWAIGIPLLYLGISYLVSWTILGDQAALSNAMEKLSDLLSLITSFTVGLLVSCITAAGEEIGWRGFLYPILERLCGRTKGILLSGSLWGVWHLPLIIAGQYQANTNLTYGLLMFMLEIILMSVSFSWLRSISGSVIPAILLHAAHNLFDQAFFMPLSRNLKTAYFAGEQGFITVLCIGIITFMVFKNWPKTAPANLK